MKSFIKNQILQLKGGSNDEIYNGLQALLWAVLVIDNKIINNLFIWSYNEINILKNNAYTKYLQISSNNTLQKNKNSILYTEEVTTDLYSYIVPLLQKNNNFHSKII